MRRLIARTMLAAVAVTGAAGVVRADDVREISFPATADGLLVLSADTHVHTAFSDGAVWPTIRVMEAERDNLDVLVITDHIDSQKHKDDIPNPDRNRSFQIARKAVQDRKAKVLVVNGVEIAQGIPLGQHLNAIFLSDANPIRHRGWDGKTYRRDEGPNRDSEAATRVAKAQGAFIIWNHPAPTGGGPLPAYISRLLADGLIDGIEVANGRNPYSPEAFAVALEHNLAVIGATDIHQDIDFYSYGTVGSGKRTATLVLAPDRSEAAIRKAFQEKRTVALQRYSLMGRERDVRPIVEASLKLAVNNPNRPGVLTIQNAASVPFTLRSVGESGEAVLFTVAAYGVTQVSVPISKSGKQSNGQFDVFHFEVINALVGPGKALRISLHT